MCALTLMSRSPRSLSKEVQSSTLSVQWVRGRVRGPTLTGEGRSVTGTSTSTSSSSGGGGGGGGGHHLAELQCQLLPLLTVTCSLLVVEPRVLGLDGRQAQFNGFIEEFSKRLEPDKNKNKNKNTDRGGLSFPAAVVGSDLVLYFCGSESDPLFGHPGCVFKAQLSAANLLLTQVNVFPELSDGVQGSVVLETQTTDLDRGRRVSGLTLHPHSS